MASSGIFCLLKIDLKVYFLLVSKSQPPNNWFPDRPPPVLLWREVRNRFGPQGPPQLTSYNNMALVYKSKGDHGRLTLHTHSEPTTPSPVVLHCLWIFLAVRIRMF